MQYRLDLSGQKIDQYHLIRLLGIGSFAAVYLAEHSVHKTPVALKILFDPLDPSNVPSFINEARVALLDHPHIVRLRDFGMYGNYPYFVMNYLANGTLRQRHGKGKRLSWGLVASYAHQIAEALEYVHSKDLVHRDIKPENMLIADDGDIQLSDFGVSVTSYTINQQMQIPIGTAYYIAPEQIDGQAVRASDQYALGTVMYEWLTGAPLFDGTRDEVIIKHLQSIPVPLRKKNSATSPQVEALIMKALSKNPDARFASMREFIVALERVQSAPIKNIPFTDHTHAVQTLSWSPDGRYIASAGHDTTVRVWEAATGQTIYVYHGHAEEIWSVMWSPDGRSLASAGADEIVHVWEPTTGRTFTSYAEHQGTIRAVAWSPTDVQVASAGDDKIVQIWDLYSSRLLYTYDEHRGGVSSLAWSPDGRYLASGSNDCTIRVWEATTGDYFCIYHGHKDRVTSLSWSPDGVYIASASDDGTIHVWNATTGKLRGICSGHSQAVSTIAWSPDGRYIASGSWDKTARVWDAGTGSCLYTDRKHAQWVNAVAWSPDSKYIASASWDKTVQIFSRDPAL